MPKTLRGQRPQGDGNQKPIQISSVNVASSEHIQMLLAICDHMQPYLLMPPRMPQVDDREGKSDEKEASTSACVVVMEACNRLESILKDDTRWSVEHVTRSQESILKLIKAQTEAAKAGRTAAQEAASLSMEARRPSTRRQCSILALANGDYLCTDGDPSNANVVKGVGATPEEATIDFDAKFLGIKKYTPFAAISPNKQKTNEEVDKERTDNSGQQEAQ